MTTKNRHGLARSIPSDVRRKVRQHSRFGCVHCRAGLYEYEHIEPAFVDAHIHDPDRICCLCPNCHDQVTKKQLSKSQVSRDYAATRSADPRSVLPPIGPMNLDCATAPLRIGGVTYAPTVGTLLRYHGVDLIQVANGEQPGEPAAISAVFTNDEGRETLRLEQNAWVGSCSNWDIEVVGPRLCVRRRLGEIALALRWEQPGGPLVVEHLDMRYEDAHVLVHEDAFAVGSYLRDGSIWWMTAGLHLLGSNPQGAAIEFLTAEELAARTGISAPDQAMAGPTIVGGQGAFVPRYGICLGSGCNLTIRDWACGTRALPDMRRVILRNPAELARFISTGG
ncbi:MAG: hypothetical protein IT452_16700 [Planctomycetia bacterium]|nr:hypothetical protein [Planctomycetia bacterium]